MKRIKIYAALIFMLAFVSCSQNTENLEVIDEFSIIPQPNLLNMQPGFQKEPTDYFIFNNALNIVATDTSLNSLAELAKKLLRTETGSGKNTPRLILRKAEMNIPEEAYRLQILKDSIVITADREAGLFYGLQTLNQILPQERDKAVLIHQAQIDDWPRFKYRGMHLDVCRHFYSVDFIKSYLDLMARYKLNTFHWHLTEDQGWRIEIKKYPLLTEIGAWRMELDTATGDSIRYGGYYTQDQIKDVVTYARKNHITIIPEIEMPGHSRAALAAYPQFSCSGERLPVANRWGVFTHVYCAGKDSTFLFLNDILDEVIALFPGTYIHIGGDECPKAAWKKCPDCQARIKKEHLKDEHELQSYFIRRIEKHLISKGRKLIGWDEILEGGLADEATVMSWRGIKGGIAAARQGHDVIMTPGSHCYFDHYQADPRFEPLAIGGYTSLKKVYSYEPVPEELNPDEAKYILGAQANLWTEYIATEHHLQYMLLPRMLALAEVNWTEAKHKNWDSFNKRLQTQFRYFDRQGINYCPGDYTVHFRMIPGKGDSLLTLDCEIYNAQIRYTINGGAPDSLSEIYKSPLHIGKDEFVKAAVFENGKAVHNAYYEYVR